MAELADISKAPSNNMGGTSQNFWLAKVDDLDWDAVGAATPPSSDGVTVAARTAWTGNFIPKVGKGFAKFNGTYNMGGATAESQGEYDGKSFLAKVPIHVAGTQDDLLDFLNTHRHGDFVLIYEDKEGVRYAHGTPVNPVKVGDGTLLNFGENAAAKKGAVLAFEANSNYAHAKYAGAIDLIP